MEEFILSPEDLTDGKIWLVKLVYLSSLVETPAEARRLISQGFVTVDGQRFLNVNEHIAVKDGMTLGVGRFSFCKIKILHA